jgi:hypothetical protein
LEQLGRRDAKPCPQIQVLDLLTHTA